MDGPPSAVDLKKRRQQNGVKSPEGHQASDAALRKDLEQAREQQEALTARLAAVESELEAARGAKADFLLQIAELKRDKQRSEEAGAQFRKWLKALSDHSRNLLGAKAAMAAAEATVKGCEEDLSLFLEEADHFLLSEKPRKKRRHLKNEEATNAIEDTPMEDRVEGEGRSQAEEEPVVEETAAEDEPTSDVAAQFKPGIKFKLGS